MNIGRDNLNPFSNELKNSYVLIFHVWSIYDSGAQSQEYLSMPRALKEQAALLFFELERAVQFL